MTHPVTPLGDRIVATQEEAHPTTATGLYLPDTAKEKSTFAVVGAIGSDVAHLKVGDKILFKEYAATTVSVDKKEYLIIREEDVLATLQ